jgi:hypothetical protein
VAKTRVSIGFAEHVALPDWGIASLAAKVDTGALTSALHVENICEWEDGWVSFDIILGAAGKRRRKNVDARVTRHGQVRSTAGSIQTLLFVTTTLRLGSVERAIEVSLVDRAGMNYRMLLGRRALSGRFVVDPGRRYLLG